MSRSVVLVICLVACGTRPAPTPTPPSTTGSAAEIATTTPHAADQPLPADATSASAPPDAWAPAPGSPVEQPARVGAAPRPPALPRADAKGCHAPQAVHAAELAYADYVRVLTERALAARGWTALATATPYALPGMLLVARQRPSCGPPGRYAIDGASNVFAYTAQPRCANVTKLKVCGGWGVGGCGAPPPPKDWYVTAPAGARMLAAMPDVVVDVPRCIEIAPTGGFAAPP